MTSYAPSKQVFLCLLVVLCQTAVKKEVALKTALNATTLSIQSGEQTFIGGDQPQSKIYLGTATILVFRSSLKEVRWWKIKNVSRFITSAVRYELTNYVFLPQLLSLHSLNKKPEFYSILDHVS